MGRDETLSKSMLTTVDLFMCLCHSGWQNVNRKLPGKTKRYLSTQDFCQASFNFLIDQSCDELSFFFAFIFDPLPTYQKALAYIKLSSFSSANMSIAHKILSDTNLKALHHSNGVFARAVNRMDSDHSCLLQCQPFSPQVMMDACEATGCRHDRRPHGNTGQKYSNTDWRQY